MNNTERVEIIKGKLFAFKEELEKINKEKEQKVNVFYAVGMNTQEVKHSAFLAWLLNPKMPHGLGSKPLKAFLSGVREYVSGNDSDLPNRETLNGVLDDIDFIADDPDIEVETEKVLVNKESRIDIFIASPRAKTVIVIENKMFTGMHDDQLNRYEDETNRHAEFKNYKKAYVYLTPEGDSPDDSDWCVYDYSQVYKIVKRLHGELPNVKANARIKVLTEDYMDLLLNDVLKGNKELKNLCRQIKREYADALDILNAYTDNVKDVVSYVKQWFEANYGTIRIIRSADMSFDFYTDDMNGFFTRNGEALMKNDIPACRVCIISHVGPIECHITLQKSEDEEWSLAQKQIMEKVAPNKKQGRKYFRVNRTTLLPEDGREEPIETVKLILDRNLQTFLVRLRDFEGKLLS